MLRAHLRMLPRDVVRRSPPLDTAVAWTRLASRDLTGLEAWRDQSLITCRRGSRPSPSVHVAFGDVRRERGEFDAAVANLKSAGSLPEHRHRWFTVRASVCWVT